MARLPLLPPGPHGVHEFSLRRTQLSTPLAPQPTLQPGSLEQEFSLAIADCENRAPLPPHLARSSAEKEGFEPSRRGYRQRDFQSRALGRTMRLLRTRIKLLNLPRNFIIDSLDFTYLGKSLAAFLPRKKIERHSLPVSLFCGGGGIRTLEALKGLTVFETAALDRTMRLLQHIAAGRCHRLAPTRNNSIR